MKELAQAAAAADRDPYKDDLEFLNRMKPEKVLQMTSTFKNEGRFIVKENRELAQQGKWRPVVGKYNPKYEFIQSKLNNTLPMSREQSPDIK